MSFDKAKQLYSVMSTSWSLEHRNVWWSRTYKLMRLALCL